MGSREIASPALPLSATTHVPRTDSPALRVVPARAAQADSSAGAPDLQWDLLLACVAGYILTAVGRIHQLFPLVDIVRPAILTGLLAVGLYLNDRSADRRSALLWVAPTKYVLTLLAWMVLSVPTALVVGNSFDLVFNNILKTVLMFVVVAGSVRGARDVERLAFTYLLGATLYASVVVMRFDLGAGADWRLGHLYYYDANDL